MTNKFSRRDFLKLSSLYLSYPFIAKSLQKLRQEDSERPNILILVYDAFTAQHMHLHGYERETTPNINRLAEKSIVYHQHYAGGHWTYPGTTSLLTGVLPWTHRAFTRGLPVAPPFDTENIFSYFEDYFSVAYTHNSVARPVLKRLNAKLDQHYPNEMLYTYKAAFLHKVLGNDFDVAAISKRRITNKTEEGYASSLFFSNLTKYINAFRERELRKNFVSPPRVTGSGELFMQEEATDWTIEQVEELSRPYLSYLHFFPPHDPYVVRNDFANTFVGDGYKPVRKPDHFFSKIIYHTNEETDEFRLAYNQAIRYVDAEFGRLMENLEKNGQLDNTIVILTSDHGEMFERGLTEHTRPVFYQSSIHVPLLIFLPGQKERIDIYDTTSALDVIPTLLYLTGKNIPRRLEGEILPPFAAYDSNRSIFSMDARDNPPEANLSLYTAMLRKGPYKFTQYYGYPQLPNNQPYFELFNLEKDPEELDNLLDKETSIAKAMREELDQKILEKDKPYGG